MEALARLAAEPELAAILLDVDGALAPIVPRPEDACVPDGTRHELRRLHERYALVACVSGREGSDARRIVGVPELVYVGNHGLELVPDAALWRERLQVFLAGEDWARIENKGITATFHFREVPDEAGARSALEDVASRATANGLVTRWGRKVLEVLPPLKANKGTAVRALLAEHGLQRALYAGDDTTDLDGFRALDDLELAVRIAVVSEEGPAELRDAADLAVSGPGELLEVLRRL